MVEITRVHLENEMDLILAHKQSMKLGELTGLSLAGQTTFATAVSEVSRSIIDQANNATLFLYISSKPEREKYIVAVINDSRGNIINNESESYTNARRLVSNIQLSATDEETSVELRFRIPNTTSVNDVNIERWQVQLNNDPEVSPYEEIKRKNKQLLAITDMLRASEQQYRQLADTLPILIFSINGEGAVSYMNKWMHDYTGQTVEELNSSKWANTIHPEDFDRARKIWADNVGYSDNIRVEARLQNALTGEYSWHSGIVSPVKNDNSEVVLWNAFLVNVQALKENEELKEMQTALQNNIQELNKSNYQLEQFAYVASHDLQEPLRKISFYSDLLQKKYFQDMPAEGSIYLENMLKSASRMKQLIHDILAYSTISKTALSNEVDLNMVMKNALDDLEMAIEEKKAIITYDTLPTIQGNAQQMKQVFENLLSNSLKYVAADVVPKIHVSAEVKERLTILYFKDNGIGFEEKYLSKMFDLFQRLHSRDKFQGTGIGLAICKKIIDIYKGNITAKSEPGRGATFIIELPQSF